MDLKHGMCTLYLNWRPHLKNLLSGRSQLEKHGKQEIDDNDRKHFMMNDFRFKTFYQHSGGMLVWALAVGFKLDSDVHNSCIRMCTTLFFWQCQITFMNGNVIVRILICFVKMENRINFAHHEPQGKSIMSWWNIEWIRTQHQNRCWGINSFKAFNIVL